MRPILLYIISQAVIPAKAGIQIENTGFRIKSGMTKCVKLFLRHYTKLDSCRAAFNHCTTLSIDGHEIEA